jgi:ATP-dependent Clp protease ATP-binding subunit ClpA
LEGQLAEKRVLLQLTPEARTLLAQQGYNPKFGARPLERVIQESVKVPLSEALLFGELTGGGTAIIDAEKNEIVLKYTAGAGKKSGKRTRKPAKVR